MSLTILDQTALPGPATTGPDIEPLLQSPRQLNQTLRWTRFRAAPLSCMLRRLGVPKRGHGWRGKIQDAVSWPPPVRAALEHIPRDFVTDWSFAADSGLWLYNHVRWSDYRTLVECGSGLSSVLLGLALRDRARYFTQVRCYSLEHDEEWLDKTRWLLCRLNLSPFVEPVHAPLVRTQTGTNERYTYDMALAPSTGIDFMLIDGPPHAVGRAGVVPQIRDRLSPNAVVVLDDAGRQSEQQCCEQWTTHNGLKLHGYLPLGHGLAYLTAQPDGA